MYDVLLSHAAHILSIWLFFFSHSLLLKSHTFIKRLQIREIWLSISFVNCVQILYESSWRHWCSWWLNCFKNFRSVHRFSNNAKIFRFEIRSSDTTKIMNIALIVDDELFVEWINIDTTNEKLKFCEQFCQKSTNDVFEMFIFIEYFKWSRDETHCYKNEINVL